MLGIFHTWAFQKNYRMGAVLGCLVIAMMLLSGTIACERADKIVLTPEQEKIVQANILESEPEPAFKVGAKLGKGMELIGFDLNPSQIKPGSLFTVTWYWRCLEEMSADWMPFVHMDSHMAGRYRLNLDHHPVGGLHRTSMWKKGQIIKDEQKASFPATFPEGEVIIWTGAFRGDDRLEVAPGSGLKTDGENRLEAGRFTLVKNDKTSGDLPTIKAWKASSSIKVDGVLDEDAWKNAASTGYWRTPDGKRTPEQKTSGKLLWDAKYLYLGIECEDTDIWSEFTKRDENLWEQEVVEVFLQPDSTNNSYAEIQVSPAGVLFDAIFNSYRSDLAKARAKNLDVLHAVKVDGTLNKRDDQDRGWVVELAIPLTQLPSVTSIPEDGANWRLNLFRLDSPSGKRQEAAAWSPPKVGDFHALHRFGNLIFKNSEKPEGSDTSRITTQGRKIEEIKAGADVLKGQRIIPSKRVVNPTPGTTKPGTKPDTAKPDTASTRQSPRPGTMPRPISRPIRTTGN